MVFGVVLEGCWAPFGLHSVIQIWIENAIKISIDVKLDFGGMHFDFRWAPIWLT